MKIERARIYFSTTFSLPSSSSGLKVPIVVNCTTSLFHFFRGQERNPDNLLIPCSHLRFSLQNSTP